MSNPSDPALDVFRGGDSVRVGTDLCSVQDVADSVERYGDRYLRRVYTDHELEYCSSDPACGRALAAGSWRRKRP